MDDKNKKSTGRGNMKGKKIAALLLCLSWHTAHADDTSELAYYQQFPVVLSASRLSQPLSESPNAMTVIDRKMIVASGFRKISDLFKLVPGMYVSYYKGSQPVVAYHGATDQYSRRMQVMIDGRSVYLPPVNTVDWADLPITIDDIERIEVIRGPAAASYGANSAQGVINIITRGAGDVHGTSVTYRHGDKGINDVSARFGRKGETFDYRMTLAYTADNGYDDLSKPPNNIPITQFKAVGLLNNSYDNNQARLFNYRANYHPNGTDNFDVQFGFNRDIQGVGFNDKNPNPSQPFSTNGNTFHNLTARADFLQLGWTHFLENASQLEVRYYHTHENQYEALPVYLGGVYFPGPVIQSLDTTRDQLQIQHTLPTSENNRLVYGAVMQKEQSGGFSDMPPLSLFYHSSFNTDDYQIFANDEWRINRQFLLNIGGMFERDPFGNKNLSPRASLNFHMTPQQTLRAGVSVAYRVPSLVEKYFPAIQPGALIIPSSTQTSPDLIPEKVVSREIGYLGEFQDYETTLDLRLFSDLLSNVIYPNKTLGRLTNGLSSKFHGFEATVKKSWGETSSLTVNFAHELTTSNAPALLGTTVDGWAASIPRNSASALFSQSLHNGLSFSAAYYYQGAMQPFDRGNIDYQPIQRRMDVRIAQAFHDFGGIKGNVALVVQNLLNQDYSEYIASNVFNRRSYIQVTANW
jgi:iron complex outermembrane recepter protein